MLHFPFQKEVMSIEKGEREVKVQDRHSLRIRTYIRSPNINFPFPKISRHSKISNFTSQAFAN